MAGVLEMSTRPLHVLYVLGRNGPMRFGALKRSVKGISSRVLTERLRTLEENKLIFREYKPSIPPEVTYGLTDRAGEFQKFLDGAEQAGGKAERRRQHAGGPAARGFNPKEEIRPELHRLRKGEAGLCQGPRHDLDGFGVTDRTRGSDLPDQHQSRPVQHLFFPE